MTKMDVEGDEKAGGGVGGLVRKSVQLGITTTREKLGHVTAKTQETVVEVAETTKKVKDTFIFIIRHCGRYIFQKGRSSCCSFIQKC